MAKQVFISVEAEDGVGEFAEKLGLPADVEAEGVIEEMKTSGSISRATADWDLLATRTIRVEVYDTETKTRTRAEWTDS